MDLNKVNCKINWWFKWWLYSKNIRFNSNLCIKLDAILINSWPNQKSPPRHIENPWRGKCTLIFPPFVRQTTQKWNSFLGSDFEQIFKHFVGAQITTTTSEYEDDDGGGDDDGHGEDASYRDERCDRRFSQFFEFWRYFLRYLLFTLLFLPSHLHPRTVRPYFGMLIIVVGAKNMRLYYWVFLALRRKTTHSL